MKAQREDHRLLQGRVRGGTSILPSREWAFLVEVLERRALSSEKKRGSRMGSSGDQIRKIKRRAICLTKRSSQRRYRR